MMEDKRRLHFAVEVTLLAMFPTFLVQANPPDTVPGCADISVVGIYLEDSPSAQAVLGDSIVLQSYGPEGPPVHGFPYVSYCNKSGKVILTLVFHPGGKLYEFAEFCVQPMSMAFAEPQDTLSGYGRFVTGKGIKRGISRDKLVEGLGLPDSTSEKESVLHYFLRDYQTSSFLKHYRMPEYYGKYMFTEDTLTSFEFGFSYP